MANVSHSNEWSLDNNGGLFRIRSITWGIALSMTDPLIAGRATWVDAENNNAVKFQLRIGEGVDEVIHSIFNEQSMTHPMSIPPGGNDFNGKRMYIYKPGQYIYNSWNVENEIQFAVDVYTCDLVNAYVARYDVLVEIEQL